MQENHPEDTLLLNITPNQKEALPSEKPTSWYYKYITPAAIATIIPIVLFAAQYIFYGRYQIDEIKVNVEAAKAQIDSLSNNEDLQRLNKDLAELDKVVKSVDAKYSESIKSTALKAKNAEIHNSEINSELASLQVRIAAIDLATRQQQRALESQIESAVTAQLLTEIRTKVRPSVEIKCRGSFRGRSGTYDMSCDLQNIGIYPVHLTPRIESMEEPDAFYIEGGEITPFGTFQPNQAMHGGATIKFRPEFIERYNGQYTLNLIYELATPDGIVEIIRRNTRQQNEKDSITESSVVTYSVAFKLNFVRRAAPAAAPARK